MEPLLQWKSSKYYIHAFRVCVCMVVGGAELEGVVVVITNYEVPFAE